MAQNHFISVSKQGVLWARRKGAAPVQIATAAQGLRVRPSKWLPGVLVVFFRHGGRHRDVDVTHVQVGETALGVEDFQTRFSVSDAELGQWMREAVDEALDAADRDSA